MSELPAASETPGAIGRPPLAAAGRDRGWCRSWPSPSGGTGKISFETLVRHHDAIHAFIGANLAVAIAIYIAVYVVVIALSLPGGLILTLSGGFLFGGLLGGAAAVVGATIGATIIFMIAKSAFGEHLARRAGPLAEKLADGFRADAFNYLLFLRLVPVFPFFLVIRAGAGRRAAGDLRRGHRDRHHPAGFAFAFVGAGLDFARNAPGPASSVVTEGAETIVAAYRLFAVAPHVEFLIDRQGYIRAITRSSGEAGDIDALIAQVRQLNEERIALDAAPDEHVH